MKMQKGFTLIELVMVIAILAILAAVALPQFTDLRTQAQAAATQSIAGSLGSATAINYAVRSLNPTSGQAVTNCNTTGALLAGGLPANYTVADANITVPGSATCTLNGPSGSSASFVAIGIS